MIPSTSLGTGYAEVIGSPIAHSKSPTIHKFWLRKLGIDADYRICRVEPDALADYLAERRADPDWRGCNVTIPHKVAVLPLLDRIDPLAARIGAVNIVVREGGALVGYNSDAPGFLEPVRPLLDDAHDMRTARILGTGGAARAIAHGLYGVGFTLVIAGRDLAAAQALADAFDPREVHVAPLEHFARRLDFDWGDTDGRLDLLVNATSLGMTGQPPLALDFSNLPPGATVYDAVYDPLETALLTEARARGFPAIDGLRMLVGQARAAFHHFFGVTTPDDADSETELRRLLIA